MGGFRTHLGLPLLRQDSVIGVLLVSRSIVEPFDDKHIELLSTFAAQAVIAIENARLLNELRQRTADLTEALEQQTATSEVLQVISSSPGDLEPVFASMLEKAIRICDANFGNIYRWDGEAFYLLATKNTPQALAEYRRSHSPVVRPAPDTLFGRLAAARKLIHIPDLTADQLYSEKKSSAVVAAVELGGVRTILVVPMLKEDELIGCVFLFRQEDQLPLPKSRSTWSRTSQLKQSLPSRTRGCSTSCANSLQQQTATADVLKVISRSTFDLQAVLDTLAESAARLCAADLGFIVQQDGDVLRLSPTFASPVKLSATGTSTPLPVDRGARPGAPLLERKAIHVPDVLADPEYRATALAGIGRISDSTLGVPLLRDGSPIGVFALGAKFSSPLPTNRSSWSPPSPTRP